MSEQQQATSNLPDNPEAGAVVLNMGQRLSSLFDEIARERESSGWEDTWLKAQRQYQGIYDPEVLEAIHDNRSKVFARFTRTKVKTMDARVWEMLFPAGKDQNWGIDPTPEPEVNAEQEAAITQELADGKAAALVANDPNKGVKLGQYKDQYGMLPKELQPSKDEFDRALEAIVTKKAEAMSSEVADQLVECKYGDIARRVIHSGHVYGTGILKGPLAKLDVSTKWSPDEGGQFSMEQQERLLPFFEFVPVWDIYPDLSSRSFEEAELIFQRHVMTRHQLRDLGKRKDFDAEPINRYLRQNKEGNASSRSFEANLQSISNTDAANQRALAKKYDVLESWGVMEGADLQEYGCEDLPEECLDMEFWANVWIVGTEVIKVCLAPIQGVNHPYQAYYFERDDESIFGHGVPEIMRDPQTIANAALRGMLDHAAITIGPQIEVNRQLFDVGEKIRDVYPLKVWVRSGTGAEAATPGLRVYNLDSRIPEFLKLLDMAEHYIDEVTAIPSYMHGENDKGVGRTVGGLSMLMGAAQITVRDVIQNYDDGITKPFITALYHWNMQFNPRQDIKGDLQVKATGVTSLVAKELQSQQIEAFAAGTLNPVDAPYVKREKLLKQRAKALSLDPEEILYTEQEVRQMAAVPQPPEGEQ